LAKILSALIALLIPFAWLALASIALAACTIAAAADGLEGPRALRLPPPLEW